MLGQVQIMVSALFCFYSNQALFNLVKPRLRSRNERFLSMHNTTTYHHPLLFRLVAIVSVLLEYRRHTFGVVSSRYAFEEVAQVVASFRII